MKWFYSNFFILSQGGGGMQGEPGHPVGIVVLKFFLSTKMTQLNIAE